MVEAAREILRLGESLLESIEAEDFTAKVPEASNSTIGAHYRHALDHFQNLLESLETGVVDYDARQRDSLVENNPEAALAKTAELLSRLDLVADSLPQHLLVRCKVSYDRDATPSVPSTPAREFMFCVSHAIHHHAMIRMLAAIRGIHLSGSAGVAPSTIAYRQQTACASGA